MELLGKNECCLCAVACGRDEMGSGVFGPGEAMAGFFGPVVMVWGWLFPVNGKQELEAPSKFCKENDFLAPCHLFSLPACII